MNYRKAKSLDRLVEQVNIAKPNRSKKSDGWIGDLRHQATKSEHNPDPRTGVVRAQDITHDPANGLHARELAEALVASRDPRILYVISEGQMCRSYQKGSIAPWTWTPYTGKNGHYHHVHISVVADPKLYDDTRDWAIDASSGQHPTSPAEPRRPMLKKGDRGDDVMFVQRRLGLKADGIFGPATETEVKAFQKQKGLTVDGIVGPATWTRLL
jgi:peptidoglycan hydrolase-like protein with peptidoglycan-binding domain